MYAKLNKFCKEVYLLLLALLLRNNRLLQNSTDLIGHDADGSVSTQFMAESECTFSTTHSEAANNPPTTANPLAILTLQPEGLERESYITNKRNERLPHSAPCALYLPQFEPSNPELPYPLGPLGRKDLVPYPQKRNRTQIRGDRL